MTEHTKCHLVDIELAQHVMGWVFVEPHVAGVDPPGEYDYIYTVEHIEVGGPYVYRRPHAIGSYPHKWERWSPTESDADALDVAKAIQALPRYVQIALHPTGECTCSIDPVWTGKGNEYACGCTAPTLRQAICGAAEERIEMRGEDNT